MRIATLFIGGMHQALHIAPVAAALAEREGVDVTAFVATPDDAEALAKLLARLGEQPLPTVVMALPRWLMRVPGARKATKILRLLTWRRRICGHDAILTAERSSTLLKRLPGRTPPMIHIPHGAGDRAKGFEPRIRLFDHVIVAGPKDRRRMLAQGLVSEASCTVSGAVKVAACRRIQRREAPLFANPRPVILYNAHFDHSLGSWQRFAEPLINMILSDDRFNLIVAPHVRMFASASAAARAQWTRRAVADRLIVDLSSERLNDMSYTSAADIYVGDVSSQVYECLTVPKPCVFLDAHGAAWRDNPDYAMWQFGPVVDDEASLKAALLSAQADHPRYSDAQRMMVADALGDSGEAAPALAADQLLAALARLNRRA